MQITSLGAAALAHAIRTRALSCAEVMHAYLERIHRLNPRVNAIVALRDDETLLAQARAADDALARGEPAGALHGVPLAIKDLEPVRGIVSTQGSPLFRDFVPDADAIYVARMRAAGGIIIGKTNVPEFGLGSQTYNPVYGPTLNPYDVARTAGGSSGGAAAALALRLLPVADGSDYGGSLRNPAAWCNVFGLRPSLGRIPAESRDVFSLGMGVKGPMARSVPDLALLLSVQAGWDARAPLSLRDDPPTFEAGLPARPARIAWLADIAEALPFEPGVLDLCRAALRDFERIGCAVESVPSGFAIERLWPAFTVLRAWQIAPALLEHYASPARRALLKPEAVYEVEQGLALRPEQVWQAAATRTEWFHAVRTLFDRYDLLALPAGQVFPFDVRLPWPDSIAGRAMDSYHRWMEVMAPGTLSGCPVIALPAGFDPRGLPMGLQLIARPGDERACLRAAHAYDEATRWVERLAPALAA